MTTPAGYRLRVRAGRARRRALRAPRRGRAARARRRAARAGGGAAARGARRCGAGRRWPSWRSSRSRRPRSRAWRSSGWRRSRRAIEADLAAGRHAALVGELRQLVAEHPTPRAARRPAHARAVSQRTPDRGARGLSRDARRARGRRRRRAGARAAAPARGDPPPRPALELRRRPGLPPELDAGAAPPLAGRDAELAWLREHWRAAADGAGRLVALCGPAGSASAGSSPSWPPRCIAAGAAVRVRRAPAIARRVSRAGRRAPGAAGRRRRADRRRRARRARLPAAHARWSPSRAMPAPSRGSAAHDTLALGPLDAAAVRAIARRASRHATRRSSGCWTASGGVPRPRARGRRPLGAPRGGAPGRHGRPGGRPPAAPSCARSRPSSRAA